MNSHAIEYRITELEHGVCLTLWEPKEMGKQRTKPFTFLVNYRFESKEKAHHTLKKYFGIEPQHPSALGLR
jgi:hypothetical protein